MLICAAEDCEKPVHCKGFCRPHYQRLTEYGRLEKVITGKTKHPLFMIWATSRQKANHSYFVKDWYNDFWKFVKDVEPKPENGRLMKLINNEPCGPDNFRWHVTFTKLENETDKERRKRQRTVKHINDPTLYRSLNYKYNFGISLEEVEAKLKSQNFVCAICSNPETVTYKNTGVVKTLSLDHCHKTDKIRDFLCSRCNLLIGRVNEDISLLQNAINYLKRHNGNDS